MKKTCDLQQIWWLNQAEANNEEEKIRIRHNSAAVFDIDPCKLRDKLRPVDAYMYIKSRYVGFPNSFPKQTYDMRLEVYASVHADVDSNARIVCNLKGCTTGHHSRQSHVWQRIWELQCSISPSNNVNVTTSVSHLNFFLFLQALAVIWRWNQTLEWWVEVDFSGEFWLNIPTADNVSSQKSLKNITDGFCRLFFSSCFFSHLQREANRSIFHCPINQRYQILFLPIFDSS